MDIRLRRDLFPPVNSGGLIEATQDLVGEQAKVLQFPPVNSGCLIEAELASMFYFHTYFCFRR